ncbi:MAG TPA: hypothetical protein VJU84_14635 [Pyrinomonadaceae bacterium]|nr:hypothetical protein [Pyrinomonadaceae bacterium]
MTRSLSKFAQTLTGHAWDTRRISSLGCDPHQLRVKYFPNMAVDEVDEVSRIRKRLRLVTEQFEREMRERGFDPQQAENVPLTQSLANLHLEQMNLRAKLAELLGEDDLS